MLNHIASFLLKGPGSIWWNRYCDVYARKMIRRDTAGIASCSTEGCFSDAMKENVTATMQKRKRKRNGVPAFWMQPRVSFRHGVTFVRSDSGSTFTPCFTKNWVTQQHISFPDWLGRQRINLLTEKSPRRFFIPNSSFPVPWERSI